jgi:protein required for attachment to host cells
MPARMGRRGSMSHVAQNGRLRRRPLDRLWVVVTDGAHARILGVTGDRRGLTILREMVSADARRRAREILSGRPAGPFGRGVAARHGDKSRRDSDELTRQRFIAQLVTMLVEDNRARQFDQLILIVPPDLSRKLREMLENGLHKWVRETLRWDLVGAPLTKIHERVVEAGLLPPARAGTAAFAG